MVTLLPLLRRRDQELPEEAERQIWRPEEAEHPEEAEDRLAEEGERLAEEEGMRLVVVVAEEEVEDDLPFFPYPPSSCARPCDGPADAPP